MLKLSQNVTLTAERKCHPLDDEAKKSSMVEEQKIRGTLDSPRSEIVRYKRNTEVVSLVNFWIRRFFPVLVVRYLRRTVLSGA
jgi:hypothetical protein